MVRCYAWKMHEFANISFKFTCTILLETCNKYLHVVLPFFNSSSLENDICKLGIFTELENTVISDISYQLETINHNIIALYEHRNHNLIITVFKYINR